jgi:signal peptidase
MSESHAKHVDRPSVVRRLSRWAVSGLMIIVILFCTAWLLPSLFGYSRYVITGGSMTGTYNIGSIVFEKKEPVADLKVGDVITYMPPADSGVDHLVTHRIYKIQQAQGGGRLYTTKGDHNPSADPWHFKLLDKEQPVVRFGVPHAGWVFIALAQRPVRMAVIGIPAALIALGALGQMFSVIRGRDEETTTDSENTRPRHAVPPQRTAPAVSELEQEHEYV